jgi:hypothetical protein
MHGLAVLFILLVFYLMLASSCKPQKPPKPRPQDSGDLTPDQLVAMRMARIKASEIRPSRFPDGTGFYIGFVLMCAVTAYIFWTFGH